MLHRFVVPGLGLLLAGVLSGCLGEAPGLAPDLGSDSDGGPDFQPASDGEVLDARPPAPALRDECEGVEPTPIPATAVPTTSDFFSDIQPMSHSPQATDINCDGFDDLIATVPLTESVVILYGGPAGILGGQMLVVNQDVGQPHLARAADFDGVPGPELIVMGTVDGRWHLTGLDLVDGVPQLMARREVDDTFMVRPDDGNVPLHLTPVQLDEDPAHELVFGSLEHIRSWPLEWSRAQFALSALEPLLENPERLSLVNVNRLFVHRPAEGPDVLIGTEEDRTLIWQHDGAAYALHSVEMVPGPRRNLRDFALYDIDPDTGWPLTVGTFVAIEHEAELVQIVPDQGPGGSHLFRRHAITPGRITPSEDNTREAIVAGRFFGGPEPEIVLLDARRGGPDGPSIVAVLPDVALVDGQFGPLDTLREHPLPRDYQPTGLVWGRFDADDDVELVFYDRLNPLLCLEFRAGSALGACE